MFSVSTITSAKQSVIKMMTEEGGRDLILLLLLDPKQTYSTTTVSIKWFQ